MALQFTKRITVHKVVLDEKDWASNGIGFDDEGSPIEFRGFTGTMRNIKTALDEFEDGDTDHRPTIHLHPWQWEDAQ
jgi:hypothetical protein